MPFSYPITSQAAFDAAFAITLEENGEALLAPYIPSNTPTALTINTITASSASIPNDNTVLNVANSSSAQTIYLDESVTVYTPGQILSIVCMGSGTVTVTPDDSTITHAPGYTLSSNGQGAVLQFMNIGDKTWVALPGGFTPLT